MIKEDPDTVILFFLLLNLGYYVTTVFLARGPHSYLVTFISAKFQHTALVCTSETCAELLTNHPVHVGHVGI